MIYDLSKMNEIDVHALSLSCVRSYLYYHESKYYKAITETLLSQTDQKWEKGVKWFVSNMARAVNKGAKGFRVSLDGHAYTDNKLNIGFRGVRSLLTFLEEKGYIDIYRGFVIEWKVDNGKRVPERAMSSCVVLKKRALDLWNTEYIPNLWKEIEDAECVEIKSRERQELLSTKGKNGVKEVRKQMIGYNDSLNGADIKFDGKPIADVEYKRVFLDSMHVAGRIYAQGGGVQLLPQELRSDRLTIDNEPVVELDYSAIHPNICYQILKTYDNFNVKDVMGENFSPYDADLSFLTVDGDMVKHKESLTGKKHNPLRNLAKIAILVGMNSVDKEQAVGGLSNKIKNDHRKKIEDQDFYGIGKISSQFVLDAVQEHNDWISNKFFSDQGVLLQNTDSKIMMEVVDTMIQKGHTILTYHDSAIVKQSAEDDLRNAMVDAWKAILGDTTFCKVDKK